MREDLTAKRMREFSGLQSIEDKVYILLEAVKKFAKESRRACKFNTADHHIGVDTNLWSFQSHNSKEAVKILKSLGYSVTTEWVTDDNKKTMRGTIIKW